MADVKRYGGRTYGKSAQQDTAASKAFDDVFAKPKQAKWGNVSYVKPRAEDELSERKSTIEEESDDPFSFEFDGDRSPKKKLAKLPPRTVVMQPAVRITSAAKKPFKTDWDDDNFGGEFTVKKSNIRPYSKSAGRQIKKGSPDITQPKMERFIKTEKQSKDFHSTNSSQGTPTTSSSSEPIEPIEVDDLDDDLYIEHDDGSSSSQPPVPDDTLVLKEESIFNRPKNRESHRNVTNAAGEEITVRFRSQYLNPEVYSKFTENIKPRDPVGSLSNSKVVHKNVLKHDSGTTLIVVCSPKGDQELKQSNTQTKYFKDNVKDIAKSKRKMTRGRPKSPEKDPFDLDEDDEESKDSLGPMETENGESPFAIPSTEESQPISQEYTTRSGRVTKTVRIIDPPPINPDPVDVDNIVKTLKSAPPRKYHRIFRSRNKGFMDPNAVAEEQEQEIKDEPGEESVTEPKAETESPESIATESESTVNSQQNGETLSFQEVIEESSQESESAMETQDSSQEAAPVLQVVGDESDIDSSQKSTTSEGQEADIEPSSQEFQEPQAKKAKTLKTPPAERKIFRARGSKANTKPGAQKKIFSSPKKAAAVYNVRSWQDEEEEGIGPVSAVPTLRPVLSDMAPPAPPEPPKLKPAMKKASSMPARAQPEMPRLTRAVHWQRHEDDDAYTSVHVSKEHKDLFTVVKNVKEAHECQEHGETQEFDDDIEYLLAGIESVEPMSTRCLSCIGLAQKSTIPAFRMHLRAHGTVAKIFGCLQDAASDPSLALCTSTLMFMLSRDRLNMDLEQESLNLMLRLLGVDQQEDMVTTLSPAAERALKRNKDRVLEVYRDFLQQSGSKQEIDVECLSTGNLAMESLLSLTSRRAGEWFKEELRTLGALDHIVDTVCSCIEAVGNEVSVLTNSNIENLKKVDRCLRVVENVTYMNADNQNYLISYKDSVLIPSLVRSLKVCRQCLSIYPLKEEKSSSKVDKESFGWVIYSCALAILRVLLNLTHDNDVGCIKIGEQPVAIETVLLYILQSPQHVPVDLRFDLYVLSLGLLINLVEHSEANRSSLLTMETQGMYEQAVEQGGKMLAYLSLVEVFKKREEAAQHLEEADDPKTPEKASPNKSGEWQESDSGMEWIINSGKKSAGKEGPGKSMEDGKEKDLDDEETFTKALHKAGKHMENSIVAAYVALLVGCLIQDNQEYKESVRGQLPDNNFEGMIFMLKKFLGFMNLTSGTESAGGKSIQKVIEILEK
ncbi:wings apart-like protein homolog [Mya arenaria]|uniref:wings apart-like protein homolog n=1 Tax=Mya arenaria TaxID=6604 RepID=UPI0022E9892D|nr:wings apart-like protein homolog [Mya arenaria]